MTDLFYEPLLAPLLDTTIKSLPVVLIAAIGLFLLRCRSAAARHLTCVCALTVLLLLPFSTLVPTRHVTVPIPVRRIELPKPVPAKNPIAENISVVTMKIEAAPNPLTSPVFWVWTIWVIGVLVVLIPLFASLYALYSLHRNSRPITDPHLQQLLTDATTRLGLHRLPDLRISDAAFVPMTWGIRPATVLLPIAAHDWSDERLTVALLHESAHIVRRDWIWHLLGRFVCALYWFHPLVWLLARRLRLESERACDDRVLTVGNITPTAYAAHLLEIARSVCPAEKTGGTVVKKGSVLL